MPLIQEIGAAGDVDDSFLDQAFDQGEQRAFSLEVLRRFGYTDDEWRIDQTQHPFMTSPGHGDIRLTTNFRPDDLSSLFATMHEFGHGVYEWGVDESIAGTPLGVGCLARSARVPEPDVGEPRRPEPLVLALLLPASAGGIPRSAPVGRRGGFLSRGQQGAPVPDQDRCGRGDLQPAHHPPLRARTGADRGATRRARPARSLERSHGGVPRRRRHRRRTRRAAGHALGRRRLRVLPDVLARQRHLRPDLGAPEEELGDVDERFERGEFGEVREWLRDHLYRMGRSSRRRRRSSASRAARSTRSRTCVTSARSSRRRRC